MLDGEWDLSCETLYGITLELIIFNDIILKKTEKSFSNRSGIFDKNWKPFLQTKNNSWVDEFLGSFDKVTKVSLKSRLRKYTSSYRAEIFRIDVYLN